MANTLITKSMFTFSALALLYENLWPKNAAMEPILRFCTYCKTEAVNAAIHCSSCGAGIFTSEAPVVVEVANVKELRTPGWRCKVEFEVDEDFRLGTLDELEQKVLQGPVKELARRIKETLGPIPQNRRVVFADPPINASQAMLAKDADMGITLLCYILPCFPKNSIMASIEVEFGLELKEVRESRVTVAPQNPRLDLPLQ